MEHGLKHIMFYVKKHIAVLAMCYNPALIRDKPLEAPASVNRSIPVMLQPHKFTARRTVSLLKPPQSPHCYLGAVDHVKIPPPPPPPLVDIHTLTHDELVNRLFFQWF